MSWWSKVVGFWTNTEEVKVRARDEDGKFVGDDKSTPNINEAYTTKRVKKKKVSKKK
tara:strand:- start:1166 stop:1336 length:171 start_codon:yes stop_codon:yes gene_type:complete